MFILKFVACLLLICTFGFILSESRQLDCNSLETSLPPGTPKQDAYKIVHEWKDDDNTYNYLARYKGDNQYYGTSAIIQCLHILVTFHTKESFRIKIIDGSSKRWEIPEETPFPHFRNRSLIPREESCCEVELKNDPFAIVVTNKETKEVMFDSTDQDFKYTNFFIELKTKLPSNNVYGFGQRAYKFKLEPGTYTIWARDEFEVIEDGRGGGNVYGHQPIGLFRAAQGNFFTTLMRNSNAKDIVITKNDLSYKMVGGVIDLVFFNGDSYPDTSLRLYHEYIGKFVMMPFWSLGYHQSRWGYKDFNHFEDLINNFKSHDIPIDVLWSDVDYMVGKETFTIDEARFPLNKLRQMIKESKIKWVPIIDCGIKVRGIDGQTLKSRAFDEGKKRDIFLRNSKGEYMLAKVWPGAVFFPDFFHPGTEGYWKDMLEDLYQMVPYSGVWIDMNEVTNFADGECQVLNNKMLEKTGRISPYSNIPYTPGRRNLETKTSSLDAVHYGGILEYDVHDLFNIMQSKVTYDYLKSKSKLPFILTRSNSPGNGQYTAVWSGDNGADWRFLQYSLSSIFNFQIFGMPFAGVDICGFMRTTTPELCLRWYQTGAFYPFSRNHNNDMANNQEPWAFMHQRLGKELLETAQITIKFRYSILKWYYSLFIAANGVGSIFRPLFFEFPFEDELYIDLGPTENQFLIGSSMMVTPRLSLGEEFIVSYFPKDWWFDFLDGEEIVKKEDKERYVPIMPAYKAIAPTFIRGGHIIHTQNVANVLLTEDLNDEFELVMALARNEQTQKLEAKGSILGVQSYDDDTIHDRCILKNCLYDISAVVISERKNDVTLSIKFQSREKDQEVPLDSLGIYGLKIWNLPLEFMEEDENKIGNTVGLLYDKNEHIVENLLTKEATSTVKDAFVIPFSKAARVKDGDTLVIKIIL